VHDRVDPCVVFLLEFKLWISKRGQTTTNEKLTSISTTFMKTPKLYLEHKVVKKVVFLSWKGCTTTRPQNKKLGRKLRTGCSPKKQDRVRVSDTRNRSFVAISLKGASRTPFSTLNSPNSSIIITLRLL